jgi:hypothetical protein
MALETPTRLGRINLKPPCSHPLAKMPTRSDAQTLLYELWYAIAEDILQRVCEVTELSEEQREALRATMLRPNDFHVVITDA